MGELLSNVLPLALGAAISPLLLTATLLTLSGKDRPLAKGAAVAAGAAVPLLILGLVGLSLFKNTVEPDSSGSHSGASAWISIVAGGLLLLLALRTLHKAPTSEEKQESKAPEAARQSGLGHSALLGLGMMLSNITTAVLYIAALKEIARADVDTGGQLATLGVLLLITLLPSLAPVTAYAVAPGAAARVLVPLGEWVKGHQRAIKIVFLLGFGAYLLVKGLTAL